MVFEVSVSSNYSISNFCYPHDPINDLSFRISRMLDLGCFLLQDGSRIGYCESFESVYPLTALYHLVDDQEWSYYHSEHLDFDRHPEINETKLKVSLHRSIIPHFSEQLQDKINNDDDLMHLIRRQIVAILYPDVFITNSEIIINKKYISHIDFEFTLTK